MRARNSLASRRVVRWAMLFFIVFPLTAQADIPSAVVVDGQYDDWDLDKDRSTPMQKKQGCNEKILPKVYLRYDNATGTLFVLVLGQEGLQGGLNKPVVNIYSLGQNILDNRDRTGKDKKFSWVMDNSTCVGWEGSYPMKPRSYTCDTALKEVAKRKKASEVEVIDTIDTENLFDCK
ncbi:hypothetical protein VU04_06125 [Desulfobulbus sp. TB]|nr:hypothetical protein [Desulfobulbus sp. TB]